MNIKIGASILAADFSCLDREIRRVEKAGIDFFHIDIMDGHFVPNITIGPGVVKNIRKVTRLPLEAHLMIERPLYWADRFIDAGADMLTLHIETLSPRALRKQAGRIKAKGVELGISLNPGTPLSRIKGLLDMVDLVLVMTVNPGFSGQRFIRGVVPKIKALRKIYDGDIAVDGGINDLTGREVIKAGANILACGTYIFKARNPKAAIRKLN
ncbi:MAG: ribulose-phosphate 3-epimerase [Candidatus Omnitrophota bacterium]